MCVRENFDLDLYIEILILLIVTRELLVYCSSL